RTIMSVPRRVGGVRGVEQFVSRVEDVGMAAKGESHSSDDDGHDEAHGVGVVASGPSSRVGLDLRIGVAARNPVLFDTLLANGHSEFALGECRLFLPLSVGHLYAGRDSVEAEAHSSKKRASIHYWITSSARSSSDGGIVRPSALAVLRLMTSSNLVGCSTGKSAGLAPLRILSTY